MLVWMTGLSGGGGGGVREERGKLGTKGWELVAERVGGMMVVKAKGGGENGMVEESRPLVTMRRLIVSRGNTQTDGFL